MSFPYHVIKAISANQTIQVISLRVINVGLFAGALVMFRRALAQAKVPAAASNVTALVFTLIPIVPLLAAHINYDNLLLLLVAWLCLLMQQIIEALRARKVPLRLLSIVVILCLLASLVK